MIYIFVVKLSFLWRIPFLIYGFLWVEAIAKDHEEQPFNSPRYCFFVLPFYLALFLMPFPLSPNSSRCRSASMVDLVHPDFCRRHRFAL